MPKWCAYEKRTLSDRPAGLHGRLLHEENMPLSTVVAQHDQFIAQRLANKLHAHFTRVLLAGSVVELRIQLPRYHAR